MTDNEKLARWQGLVIHQEDLSRPRKSWGLCTCGYDGISHQELMDHLCDNKLPNYLNDDAAAMSLLDTLVEKQYPWKLWFYEGYHIEITHGWDDKTGYILFTQITKPTRREAVVAVCLELLEKENTDDPTR